MTVLQGLLWLTLNVYYEARSEPMAGKVAIVHVTLNRAKEQHMPIKDVVTQPYQFSWTFQKHSYIPHDTKAFLQCLESVYIALQTADTTQGATHYHADNVNPAWAAKYTYIEQIGSHKFYK